MNEEKTPSPAEPEAPEVVAPTPPELSPEERRKLARIEKYGLDTKTTLRLHTRLAYRNAHGKPLDLRAQRGPRYNKAEKKQLKRARRDHLRQQAQQAAAAVQGDAE